MEIANNDDRKLANYIREVFAGAELYLTPRMPPEHDPARVAAAKVLECMASILVDFRNGRDAKELGETIAIHG